MRDKYVELIREYIRSKPEYKSILNEIKANILTIGATEEEFNEAVRELSGLSNASKTFVDHPSAKKSFDKKPFFSFFPTNHLGDIFFQRKIWVAAISLTVILGIAVALGFNFGRKNSEDLAISNPIANSAQNSIAVPDVKPPLVYANTQPVDAKKIFSAPYKKIELTVNGKPKKEIVGFFPYWMLDEQDKIDLKVLSSINLFGLEADGKGNIVTHLDDGQPDGGWLMWQSSEVDTLIKRAKSLGLKVNLTVKAFNASNIESLATKDDAQKNFISNVLYLINSKDLDGVNIDFEYLGDSDKEIREGFTRLITNLNAELKRQIPGAELTVDTYLVSASQNGIFDISALSNQIDYFIIMGYDMHTPLGVPGPVSAMGGDANIIGYAQNYLEKTTPDKLVLAVPYYGYDWPASAASNPSRESAKTVPYAEIVSNSKNLQLSWDDTSQTPFYSYIDSKVDRVVHFDNVRSLSIKYDFINRKDLRGVGIWALGYDGESKDLEQLLVDKFIN